MCIRDRYVAFYKFKTDQPEMVVSILQEMINSDWGKQINGTCNLFQVLFAGNDDSTHIDVEKDSWSLLDKSRAWGRLLIYDNGCAIGFLRYLQGKDLNSQKCFFNIQIFYENLNIQKHF